jgi:Zn-dependent M28 family amino/carboxypeptidase
MSTWIGDTFTSDAGWTHLERLVDVGNRMAGSTGERRAAEATRDALDRAGARDARLEAFPVRGWTRGTSRVEAGATTQECIALPRSPADEVTGELVDLGYGLPADFEESDLEGAVAMARSDVPDHHDRYIHRREKYYYAVEGGAAAFVYRNHVPGQLPPTGSVGTDDSPVGDVPAVGVSREVGARLARRFDGESVAVAVEAETGDATSQNVHAELGPDTDERVLVTSHVDAHDIAEGAMDNGAGTAVVVELAGALAAREGDLDTRVEFVVYGAEEVGLVGSNHHAGRTDLESVRAVVNLDGVCRGRTLKLGTNGFDALGAAAEGVAERFDHPVTVDPTCHPHSDHWPFVVEGVPGVHVMSETGDQGRGWGHTHADTLDKLASRDLRESAILLTAYVVDVAGDGFDGEHVDPSVVADALEAEGRAEGMKLVGDWPFESQTSD